MKKTKAYFLTSIIVVTALCAPVSVFAANAYETCKLEKHAETMNWDSSPDKIPEPWRTEYQKLLDTPVTGIVSGRCGNAVVYECKEGDTPRNCLPECAYKNIINKVREKYAESECAHLADTPAKPDEESKDGTEQSTKDKKSTKERFNDFTKKAGSSIKGAAQKAGNGIKSGANAVAGLFKGGESCNEEADAALKGTDTNIEKTKLDTKQGGTDGPKGDDGNPKSGKCVVSKCKKGYTVNDAKTGCDKSEGECTPSDENATAGELKKGKCIITECGNGWHPSDDGTSCEEAELSEKGYDDKIKDLKDNAQKMKEKEQSLANRTLTAAAIGTSGTGLMEMLSGKAEQDADAAAEADMKAYIATFACDYGAGRNIKGGQTSIEVPGGNDLFAAVTEYRTLAADLKTRKEALGKQPGIESEVIYDIAETGLYDYVGMGRQSGASTSLYRALTDENSKDAAEWAQQKADSAAKVKKGTTLAAVGIIGGAIGNLAINSGDKNKNRLGEISIKEYDKKKRVVKKIEDEANKVPQTKQCPSNASGAFPNCNCTGGNSYFHADANECTQCGTNEIVNSAKNGCECQSGMTRAADGTCGKPDPDCKLTGDFTDMVNCQCTGNATQNGDTCECTSPNYKDGDGSCVACDLTTHTLNNGQCVEREDGQKLLIKIPGDTFFDTGKDTLTVDGQKFFDNFNNHIKDAHKTEYGAEPTEDQLAEYKSYYVCIVGHTDKSKYKGESDKYEKNIDLSQRRATTVEKALNKNGFNNTTATGVGPFKCENNARNYQPCRKVDLILQSIPCDDTSGTGRRGDKIVDSSRNRPTSPNTPPTKEPNGDNSDQNNTSTTTNTPPVKGTKDSTLTRKSKIFPDKMTKEERATYRQACDNEDKQKKICADWLNQYKEAPNLDSSTRKDILKKCYEHFDNFCYNTRPGNIM